LSDKEPKRKSGRPKGSRSQNKLPKQVCVNFWVPEEVHDRLSKIAYVNMIPITVVLKLMLNDYLRKVPENNRLELSVSNLS
tara:strand:- start:500 stop:742 length:243 start_codon:yes stop_codon:yes gene_type:complete